MTVSMAVAPAVPAVEAPFFTLYTSVKCPYAQRTWIAARELGVPFKLHEMELMKDNREEWFLKLNPLGKVPTIVCDDDVVYESLVILEYLADRFPLEEGHSSSALLPAHVGARAKARIQAQRSNELISAFYTYLSNKDEATEDAKREKFEKEIRTLNDWAAAGAKDGEECGWLCGEAGGYELTLADIAYFPFMERIDATLEKFKGFSLSDMEVPAVVAWMEKCKAKESVGGTVRDPQGWVELYKNFLGADYFVKAGIAK